MNKTNFEHAFFALLMMLPFALLGHWIAGAAFGSAFFLGREHAQFEFKLAKAQNKMIGELNPLEGFQVWKWNLDSQLDLLFPVVATVVAAVLAKVFGWF